MQLELALDEPDEDDVTQSIGGITFCMRKKLMEQVREVQIDHDGYQFHIFTERTLSAFGYN